MITPPTEARIDAVAPTLRWGVLARSDADRVQDAASRLLEEVGAQLPSGSAQAALQDAGCRVDRGTQTVRLPRRVVRDALAEAPGAFLLAGREPQHDLAVDRRHCHLGAVVGHRAVDDPVGGERRPPRSADVATAARLVDGSPAFAWCRVPASSSPDGSRAADVVHDAEALLGATSKHLQMVAPAGRRPTLYLMEMAAAAAGGRQTLRRRPVMSFVQPAVGPLKYGAGAIEAAVVAAEHGLPVGLEVAAPPWAERPSENVRRLAVCLATALAGVVLLQVVAPGAPCFVAVGRADVPIRGAEATQGSALDCVPLGGRAERGLRLVELCRPGP